MKPLTGWPRKGSVLPALRFQAPYNLTGWQQMVRYVAGFDVPVPTKRAIENNLELFYRTNQSITDWEYRHGIDNAGLPENVIQAIQWMAGTPQFTSRGLQIVPMTDEQFDELESELEAQRQWRAEEIPYWPYTEGLSRALGLDDILG
jgi:hypothetical protein